MIWPYLRVCDSHGFTCKLGRGSGPLFSHITDVSSGPVTNTAPVPLPVLTAAPAPVNVVTTAPVVAAGTGGLSGLTIALLGLLGGVPHAATGPAVISGAGLLALSVLGFLAHHLGVSKAKITTGTTWIEGHLDTIEAAASELETLPEISQAVAEAKNLATAALEAASKAAATPAGQDVEAIVRRILASLGGVGPAAGPVTATAVA